MAKRIHLTALVLITSFLYCWPLCAQVESDSPVLPHVAQAMERFVEDQEVAGVVTLVADSQNILHLHAVGLADIDRQEPLAQDSLFWIASMTKPITGVCVMMHPTFAASFSSRPLPQGIE